MKIEKVNENQIRCTLTREDLVSRELKISELAYGTEKAKTLFRDMMRQANFEFGFEAEDIPLMIEAIPLNAECIVLIITKVEDPEELDTRFSRFAPSVTEGDDDFPDDYMPGGSEEGLELFQKIQANQTEEEPSGENSPGGEAKPQTRIFRISSLQQVMSACAIIADHYQGASTLYKDSRTGKYLLLVAQEAEQKDAFDKACNILSEYGAPQHGPACGGAFLAEHCESLIPAGAVQALGMR